MNRIAKSAGEPVDEEAHRLHPRRSLGRDLRTLRERPPRDGALPEVLTFPRSRRDARPTVFIVDNDILLLRAFRRLLSLMELPVETYATSRAFLDQYDPQRPGCLILEARMPGFSGLDLHRRLRRERRDLPVILLAEHPSVAMAVRATRQGAFHFLSRPVRKQDLLDHVQRALTRDLCNRRQARECRTVAEKFAELSPRERDILGAILRGRTDRAIAARFDVTVSTIKFYEASLLRKVGVQTVAELIRLMLRTDWGHPLLPTAAKSRGL